MIVLLNGSFGVGKTTVARLLRASVPGSAIYDPEWVGFVIKRLPEWVPVRGRGTGDYQDVPSWRASVARGVRLFRAVASGPVIVPMAFSRRDYFDEIVGGLRRLDPEVRAFCLRAGAATIAERLARREGAGEGPGAEWLRRRVAECVEAHRDPHFGEHVETERRSAAEVADDVLSRLRGARR
jgi:hypothetical protein